MDVKAAIAFGAGEPLKVETVQLEGPKPGEVLVDIKSTGVCHTDEYTRSGADPEGLFPSVLGHEGAGVVVEVGEGVTSVAVGDHVIPLYTPECRQCEYCLNPKTNLCVAIRSTQGQGLMPDGTTRLSLNGESVQRTFDIHCLFVNILQKSRTKLAMNRNGTLYDAFGDSILRYLSGNIFGREF